MLQGMPQAPRCMALVCAANSIVTSAGSLTFSGACVAHRLGCTLKGFHTVIYDTSPAELLSVAI